MIYSDVDQQPQAPTGLTSVGQNLVCRASKCLGVLFMCMHIACQFSLVLTGGLRLYWTVMPFPSSGSSFTKYRLIQASSLRHVVV